MKWTNISLADWPPRGAILDIDGEIVKVIRRDAKKNKIWVKLLESEG